MSPSIALQKALYTPEILEAILMKLDMRTLLVSAQQVSKSWQYLISESVQLQRALFFEPDPRTCGRQHNPLLAATFPFCFEHLRMRDDQDLPFVSKYFSVSGPREGLFLPIDKFRARKAAFSRAGASWRRMLVHQPPLPASRQVITTRPFAPSGLGEELFFVLPPEGKEDLRMPDLLRAILTEFTLAEAWIHGGMVMSAFRVIWNRVPPGLGHGEIWQIISDEIIHSSVVVQQIVDTRRFYVPDPNIRELETILLN